MVELEVLDGVQEGDRFVIRGILGHAVYSVHSAEQLRSLGRLIDSEGEDFTIRIDKNKTIFVPKEKSIQLRKEYFLLANELEGTF